MKLFPKTDAALQELRVACRKLACANLRAQMMVEEMEALGPHATAEQVRKLVEKYERKN